MLEYLVLNPRLLPAEIGQDFELPLSVVGYHVHVLAEFGLVRVGIDGAIELAEGR